MNEQQKMTHAEIVKRYREKNPEKVKESQKKWREANKEKIKKRAAEYKKKLGKKYYSEYMKEWRVKNPNGAKSADLKKKYGISYAQYAEKLESQGGVCAICGCSPSTKSLAVDHNHETGQIRDIICHACNTSLGLLKECKQRLSALSKYIDKWNL
jgi:23S rRNA pseudoU1915 N3-methylase RlmH